MTEPDLAARRAAVWRSLPLAPLVAALMGLAVLVWALISVRAEWRLAGHGVWTEAVVTEASSTRWRANGRQRYSLSYVYEVGGRSYPGRVNVTGRFQDNAPPGSRLPLRYDPAAPRLHAVGGTGSMVPVLVALAAGLSGLIGGVWLAWPPLRDLPARLRAAGGVPRSARVVAQAHVPGGQLTPPRIRIRWQDSEGGQGDSGPLPPARAPASGQAITVRIDPRTGRGWWNGAG